MFGIEKKLDKWLKENEHKIFENVKAGVQEWLDTHKDEILQIAAEANKKD